MTKKITDLVENRDRSIYMKDELGNRYRDTEEIAAVRPINTVSAGARFGHYVVDTICYYLLLYVNVVALVALIELTRSEELLTAILSLFGGVVIFLSYPAYYAFFEFVWQKTPGKFLTKTLVIDEYGNKPDARQIALRSLIRIVPFELFSCLNDGSYGWHDRWANTYVVTETELKELKRLQQEQDDKLAYEI